MSCLSAQHKIKLYQSLVELEEGLRNVVSFDTRLHSDMLNCEKARLELEDASNALPFCSTRMSGILYVQV